MDKEQKRAEMDRHQKEGFDRWLKGDMVAFMISTIPPDYNQALMTLLKTAHENGFTSGAGYCALDLLNHYIEKPRKG